MTTNYKNITIETENGIGLLTINRPDKLNALNIETSDNSMYYCFLFWLWLDDADILTSLEESLQVKDLHDIVDKVNELR